MTTHAHMREVPRLLSYALGFFLSLACTLIVFGLSYVQIESGHAALSRQTLTLVVTLFALLQLGVQAIFFLHLSRKAQFNFLAFIFTLYTVAFIVIGSLWIMKNLEQNMTPEEVGSYMHLQD